MYICVALAPLRSSIAAGKTGSCIRYIRTKARLSANRFTTFLFHARRRAFRQGCTYKKHVGEDAAQHTSLDNTNLVRLERNDRHLSELDKEFQSDIVYRLQPPKKRGTAIGAFSQTLFRASIAHTCSMHSYAVGVVMVAHPGMNSVERCSRRCSISFHDAQRASMRGGLQ